MHERRGKSLKSSMFGMSKKEEAIYFDGYFYLAIGGSDDQRRCNTPYMYSINDVEANNKY